MAWMKYIIMEHEIPIIFPEFLNHADVARYQGAVVSAGFCCINLKEGKVSAWGKSVSLEIESRKQDAEIITEELNRWDRY